MKLTKKNEPIRTCVGCGKKALKSDLVRLVVREGKFCRDERKVMAGRGLYTHPGSECAGRIKKNKRFSQYCAQAFELSFATHAPVKGENQGVNR